MIVPVSTATENALREAMTRLLEGSPVRTDGRLTIANLAREAGVARATANRATEILIAYRQAILVERVRGPVLEGEPEGRREERRAAQIRAQHIQARALQQRQEEQRASRADVLPFRRNPNDRPRNKRSETP